MVDAAHRHGALCVFDEIITGFRLAPGGAAERYGVVPDLACYGKALGNGMPMAAIGGPGSIMTVFEEVFFSGTHGGETLSLAAARAVLDTLADGTVLGPDRAARSDACSTASAELIGRHDVGHRVTVGRRAATGRGRLRRARPPGGQELGAADDGRARRDVQRIDVHLRPPHPGDVDRALAAFDEAFAALAGDRVGRRPPQGSGGPARLPHPVSRPPGPRSSSSGPARSGPATWPTWSHLGAQVTSTDPDPDRARGHRAPIGTVPFDLDRLDGYDGIVVASPTRLHLDQARAAVATGAAVMVEKPLAERSRRRRRPGGGGRAAG